MWEHSIWYRKALIPPGVMENSQGRIKPCWAQHRGAAQFLWISVVYSCWVISLISYPLFPGDGVPLQSQSASWWITVTAGQRCSKLLEPSSWALLAAGAPHSRGPGSATWSYTDIDSLLTFSTSPQLFGKFALSFSLLDSADNRSLQEQDSFIQSSLKAGKGGLQRQENGTQCSWAGKGMHSD